MRLVTFRHRGQTRLGSLHENEIVDLNASYQVMLENQGVLRARVLAEAYVPPDLVTFLRGGEESFNRAREAIAFAKEQDDSERKITYSTTEVRLEAPVLNPQKIICVGLNYRDHILEMKRELPKYPVIFAKFGNAVIGPEDNIPLSPITNKLDYEGEFAFVIGKRAKNIPKEKAYDVVAGYTIVNDVTARDLQRRTIQWLQGKTLDGSAPMGPCLVTRDEIPNPHSLDLQVTVNGEVRQQSNTEQLVFGVDGLVSFLSDIMTLEPGDVICTGTPGGVGFARDPQVFLQDGDVVRIEVENIGVLENRVQAIQ